MGVLSFRRLVGYHPALVIELHKRMLLSFQYNDSIPSMARNLHLEDHRMINKFHDKLHTSVIKHGIYQEVHFLHNQATYPLPSHLAQAFEILDELITRLLYIVDKNEEIK